MLHPELGHSVESVSPLNVLEKDLYEGGEEETRMVIAYVSKMFAVRTEELPENQRRQLTAEDMRARAKAAKEEKERIAKALVDGLDPDSVEAGGLGTGTGSNGKVEELTAEEIEQNKYKESLMGFARLYSGTIKVGQTLYAVLPKYNSKLPATHPRNLKHLTIVKVEQLYMMMGRELVVVKEVTAGNLFAIGGLDGKVARNGTLCRMGAGKEMHEGQIDSECLVNLAGITQTVSSFGFDRLRFY